MKKRVFPLFVALLLVFCLTACSSKPRRIEGRYYYTEHGFVATTDYYIEFFLDGTFKTYTSWFTWWQDGETELHKDAEGTYNIYTGNGNTVIELYWSDRVKNSGHWSSGDMSRRFLYNENVVSDWHDARAGNYIKEE